jgi:hypothetical protein
MSLTDDIIEVEDPVAASPIIEVEDPATSSPIVEVEDPFTAPSVPTGKTEAVVVDEPIVESQKPPMPRMYYRGAGMTPEQIKEAAEDLKAYKRDVLRIGAQAAKNVTGLLLNRVLPDFDINDLKGKSREQFLNKATNTIVNNSIPFINFDITDPRVSDETGRILPMETIGGTATQLGAFFMGGAKATKGAEWVMEGIQNAPKITKAAATILGFESAAVVTFDANENLANVIQDAVASSEDPEAEYTGKTIVDFMAASEDDTEGVKKLKLMVEGLAFSSVIASLKIIPMSYTAARQKVLGKRFDEMTKEEADAELIRYMSTVRQEQSLKSGAPVKETEAGLRQVEAQRTAGAEKDISTESVSSFVKTTSEKTMGYITKAKQQFFTSRGYATPLLFEAMMDSKFAQKQMITAAENTASRLNIALESAGNDPKLLEKVSVLLESDLSTVYRVRPEKRVAYFAKQRKIPEDVAEEILEARSMIDELSTKILNTKGFSTEAKEAIDKGLGTYLRKSYKIFEDPGYIPTTIVQKRAKDYIVKNIVSDETAKALAKGKELTESQLNRIAENASLTADTQIKELLGNTDEIVDYMAQVQRVGKFHKRNKDLAPEIKELLGEIKSPTDSLVLSISKASRILEMQNFYNSANQLGKKNYILSPKVAAKSSGRYNTKISGTNSILDGKVTTPERAEFLARKEETYKFLEADNSVVNGYKYYIGVKGLTQAMKTTWSHTTHARNIVGGYQFGLANGRILSHMSVSGEESAYKVLKNRIYNKKGSINKAGLDKAYEEYLRLGIINTSVNVNQFRAMMDTGFEQGLPRLAKPLEKVVKKSEKATRAVQKVEKAKTYDAIINKPNEIYMASDDFFKIGAYEAELKTLIEAFPNASESLLKQQAAKIVRNTMPNYDQIPKGIKAMRNLPFGNFVAFPAEIVRTSAHIVKQAGKEINSGNATLRKRGLQRLAGFVTTQVGFGTAAKFSHDALGFSDQDVEDRRLLTSGPYSSGHDMIYTRNDDGDIYKLNTQYLNSYYSLLSPVREAYDEIQSGRLKGEALNTLIDDAVIAGIKEFTKPYITESMSAGPLRSLATGLTSDDGRDNEGRQVRTEKGGVKWEAVFDQFKRGYAPGSYLSIEKLLSAEAGKPNEYTLEYRDPKYERIAQAGIKWERDNNEDLENGFISLMKDYKLLDRQNYLDNIRVTSTLEDIDKDLFQTNAKDFENQQDLYIAIQAARRQIGDIKTMALLQENGIPKEKAKKIYAGLFVPADLPENVMSVKEEEIRQLKTVGEQDTYRSLVLDAKIRAKEVHAYMSNLPLDNAGEFSETRTALESERKDLATGGVVSEPVPNAPVEPDERINKLTGLPYNEEAGPAYMDIEDPLRALNMAAGGRVKKSAGGEIIKLFIKKTAPVVAKSADEFVEKADDYLANSASKTTQRANTVGTATKASNYLDEIGAEGRSLDYGAGKGLNAQANKIDDTFEPFPEEAFSPTFVSPKEVPENTYGKVISTNVINVLPPNLRKEAVTKIGKSLKSGGKALIQTWDAGAAKAGMASKKATVVDDEPLAFTTSTGSYQKGFTNKELEQYVTETLGEGFEVSAVPSKKGISGVSVVITRKPQRLEKNKGGKVLNTLKRNCSK